MLLKITQNNRGIALLINLGNHDFDRRRIGI